MDIRPNESAYIDMSRNNKVASYVEMKDIDETPKRIYENTSVELNAVRAAFPLPTSDYNYNEIYEEPKEFKNEITLEDNKSVNSMVSLIGMEEGKDSEYIEDKIKKKSLINRNLSCSLKTVMCISSVALTAFAGISGVAFSGVNHLFLNQNTALGNRKYTELTNENNSLFDIHDNVSVVTKSVNMSHANSPYRGYIKTTTQENFKITTKDDKINNTREPSHKYLTKISKIDSIYLNDVILRHNLGRQDEGVVLGKIKKIMENINKKIIDFLCMGDKEKQIALDVLSGIKMSINLYNKYGECFAVLGNSCARGCQIEKNKNKLTISLDDDYKRYFKDGYFTYIQDVLAEKKIYSC